MLVVEQGRTLVVSCLPGNPPQRKGAHQKRGEDACPLILLRISGVPYSDDSETFIVHIPTRRRELGIASQLVIPLSQATTIAVTCSSLVATKSALNSEEPVETRAIVHQSQPLRSMVTTQYIEFSNKALSGLL